MVSIKKLLLQNMLIITFISFAALYLLWIQNEYTAFKEDSAAIKNKFVEKKKKGSSPRFRMYWNMSGI